MLLCGKCCRATHDRCDTLRADKPESLRQPAGKARCERRQHHGTLSARAAGENRPLTWGPFWDHTLCAVMNDLRVYKRLARSHPATHSQCPGKTCFRDLLGVKWSQVQILSARPRSKALFEIGRCLFLCRTQTLYPNQIEHRFRALASHPNRRPQPAPPRPKCAHTGRP